MSYGRRLFPVRQCWQLQSMIPIPLLWINKKQNQRRDYFRFIFSNYPPFIDKYTTKPETKIWSLLTAHLWIDIHHWHRLFINWFVCLLNLLTFLPPCFSLSLRFSGEQIELMTINNLQLIQYNPTIIGSPSAHSTLSQCKLDLTNLT